MASSSQQARSKALNELLAARLQDYEALSREMEKEVSPVNKSRYKRELSDLDEEIKKLDASIVELDQEKLILNWEKDLPEIDFRKAKAAFLEVQEQLGSEAGAALFLLQRSNVMGGEWCLKHIRDLLSRKTRDFSSYRIQFFSYEVLDEAALLTRLGGYFGLQSPPVDLQQHVQLLIEKINSALHMGRIILVELFVSASVSADDRFLPWLLHDFWCPLVRKFAELGQKSHARFVVIMLADSAIPAELLARFCCSKEQFCGEKILELPLELWQEADIRDWLILFSGMNRLLNENQITTMAKNIYLASNAGQPSSVYTQLMSQLSKISPP